ncbi:alpha-tubulin N-acetyltransferase isoform X4 [Tribolium castaneum]|uniref:Alpha-tubulin N-acetyltransferase n=1 Tax=Tribolium castaneum TaxID=7070 RepID=D6WEE9_TRICA|nr:PREDICTED: alpha-tubulin N-acetyltransferase isoform X4 [Tribolium castaneum]EFA00356.2 Alpha-tubulin N-acetyltransferase 1-like Protein [Tribolium castaneum]|eukprot:XP_015832981.1 PREDICTED: alpha-tubulin N-acetyltransferase isoform X4 [Tribolium castaneum]
MEFKFAVNDVFKQPIVKIGNNLLPPGFTGDRRAFWDVVGKVSEVVNAMGEASAAAQGLTKPITTAERLRNSEHSVYLLIDQNAGNGRGAVTGMLKTGMKGLYVFDRNGQHYQVSPPCVLDFYVHESRQRTGLGKRLFEHMLQTESIEPVKMAIDRPSEKFLGFLNKHYSLNNPVKQMNNYVVFDGFFPGAQDKNGTVESHSSHSNTPVGKKQSANGLQTSTYASPLGRYGAPRPPCSMGQIIHNQTSTIAKTPEPTGETQVMDEKVNSSPKLERPRSLSIQPSDEPTEDNNQNENDVESEVLEEVEIIENLTIENGADVVDTKNEKIATPEAKTPGKRTPSHLTEQGFFDLKFYHNKLW